MARWQRHRRQSSITDGIACSRRRSVATPPFTMISASPSPRPRALRYPAAMRVRAWRPGELQRAIGDAELSGPRPAMSLPRRRRCRSRCPSRRPISRSPHAARHRAANGALEPLTSPLRRRDHRAAVVRLADVAEGDRTWTRMSRCNTLHELPKIADVSRIRPRDQIFAHRLVELGRITVRVNGCREL